MKIKQTLLFFSIFVGICFSLVGTPVLAKAGDTCGGTTLKEGQSCCGGIVTSIVSCNQAGDGSGVCPDGTVIKKDRIEAGDKCSDGSTPNVISGTGVWGILMLIINILTAGVGVLAVGGIVYGSILYASATDSVEQKKRAKVVILNVVVGIVVYALMYSFLNFIVPGGIFAQ